MTDDSLTNEAELASAAFDGEVSPMERVRIEATPQGRQLFEAYSQLRSELVDIEIPPTAREAAVAAALSAFDDLQSPAGDDTVALAPVISLSDRRRRQYRWLSGAAAAVAVLVVGAAVINSGGDDKKSSGSFDAAAQNSQTQKSQTATAPIPQAGAPTGGPTAVATAGSTPMAGGINSPAVVTAWALAPSFTTAAELASYASNPGFGRRADPLGTTAVSTAAATAGTMSATDERTQYNTNCLAAVTTPFAAVVFQGQQVLAIRDPGSRQLSVIDPATCRTVTTIALP